MTLLGLVGNTEWAVLAQRAECGGGAQRSPQALPLGGPKPALLSSGEFSVPLILLPVLSPWAEGGQGWELGRLPTLTLQVSC